MSVGVLALKDDGAPSHTQVLCLAVVNILYSCVVVGTSTSIYSINQSNRANKVKAIMFLCKFCEVRLASCHVQD
jgi:hypothetical protein